MYLDDVKSKLTEMLTALPTPERESEMDEVVATVSDHLSESPRRLTPESFAKDLFKDPQMISLVNADEKNKLAMSAETPSELVTNLLPSDGHLD